MMRAVVIKEGKKVAVEEKEIITIDKLREDEVRVKVVATAVNPTDWKHVAMYGAPAGVIVGCDYSGIVDLVGSAVSRFKVGDHIGGIVHGAYHQHTGAFAERAVVTADVAFHKYDHYSHEENATFGIGALTAAACLYQRLELPMPSTPLSATTPSFLLVWSGATSVGQYAVQLGALSGFTVITTCSPKNFPLLSSLGASHCFDYRDPDVVKKIREVTRNELNYGLDCISEEDTLTKSMDCMGHSGGKLAAILFTEVNHPSRKDVLIIRELLYTAMGKEFVMGVHSFPAVPEDRVFTKRFIEKELEPLLAKNKLRPNVVRLGEGGLDAISDGMDYLQAGKVSGEKLVYRIQNE